MRQHKVWSSLTADEIESLARPLAFYSLRDANAGDYVIVTSSDGAVFLGHVDDTDPDRAGYVELS